LAPGDVAELCATDPRTARLTESELDDLRSDMATRVLLADPATGEARALDLEAPASEHQIAAADVVYVGSVGLPADPRTGSVGVKLPNLPAGLNKSGFFPLRDLGLVEYMRTNGATLGEFMTMLPLIDVPVFTSGLTCLMRVGSVQTPTQSAFGMLRFYFTVLRVVANSGGTRSRVPMAMEWLGQRTADGTITSEDIALVESFATVAESAAPFDPFANLQMRLHDSSLTEASVLEMVPYVVAMARGPSDPAARHPWQPEGKSFVEDIQEEHKNALLAESSALGARIDRYGVSPDLDEVRADVFRSAVNTLRIYEITIMTLLSEECTFGNCPVTIPREFFACMLTQYDYPDPATQVHVDVEKQVHITRAMIGAVRGFFCSRTASARAAIDSLREIHWPTGASAVTHSVVALARYECVPSDSDVASYLAFIRYLEAADDDELLLSITALGDVYADLARAGAAAVGEAAASATVEIIANNIATGTPDVPDARGVVWEGEMRAAKEERAVVALQLAERAAAETAVRATLASGEGPTLDLAEDDDGSVSAELAELAANMNLAATNARATGGGAVLP